MRNCARTIAMFVNRVGSLTLTLDSYPTSECPFDSSGHVIAQFLRSLQRSLDPDNLHLASRNGDYQLTARILSPATADIASFGNSQVFLSRVLNRPSSDEWATSNWALML